MISWLSRNKLQTLQIGLFPSLWLLSLTHHDQRWSMLAMLVWMLVWWIKQMVPFAVTALIPLLALPVSGILPQTEVAKAYADPVIFLFLAGFLLATGLEKHLVHRKIAGWLVQISPAGGNGLLLALWTCTALLSMWISNTATAVMMLPLGLSIYHALKQQLEATDQAQQLPHFGTSLFLGIAYAANIGGTATLIGTPPNVVFAALSRDFTGTQPGFGQWMLLGVPFALLLLLLMHWLLNYRLFPSHLKLNHAWKMALQTELNSKQGVTADQKRVLWVFGSTAMLWIFKTPLVWLTQANWLNDTFIGLLGALMLFVVPQANQAKQRLLSWDDTQNLPWGILLLFGGGLSLAKALEHTGLIDQIGQMFTGAGQWWPILVILLLSTVSLLLTEVMSNVALIAVFLPLVFGIAQATQLPPMMLAVPVTLASSCAFMMPISTPPNAIVFGSGLISSKQMLRAGIWLNLMAITLLSLVIGPLAQWL